MSNTDTFAIVGASGVVGRELCTILVQRGIPASAIAAYASESSEGRKVTLGGAEFSLRALRHPAEVPPSTKLCFFCAGASVSREFVPEFLAQGCRVIDLSSNFRDHAEVPLIVPEVNAGVLENRSGHLVANPNCVAAIVCAVLAPITDLAKPARISLSTYQAVSGAGLQAMDELRAQSTAVAAGDDAPGVVFDWQIAFNLFSHDSAVADDGYNGEERKIMAEIRKIFAMPDLPISVTCMRVPVFRAHTVSMDLRLSSRVDPAEINDVLRAAPGISLVDDPHANRFPMPIVAAGKDEVLVGRVRQDHADQNGLKLLLCGDQIRKGAALNAVQIAELDPTFPDFAKPETF